MTTENADNLEKTFTSHFVNEDGQKLFCKYWPPPGTPRALLYIAHGFAEHCLVYEPLAKLLASKNFYVFAHDHVGHGQSEGPRAHVDKFDNFIRDVFRHVDMVKKKFPNLPVLAIAHSMGGTIAISSLLKRPKYFKGVVLIAPAVMLNTESVSSLKIALVRILGRVFPNFPAGYCDFNLATSCSKALEKMNQDPLYFHGYYKAGGLLKMACVLQEIEERWKEIDFPFLMLNGDNDKICDVKGARALYENSSSHDKSIKIYPKAYHALLHEPNGVAEEVTEDIVQWLDQRA